jgi:hypothetical protein
MNQLVTFTARTLPTLNRGGRKYLNAAERRRFVNAANHAERKLACSVSCWDGAAAVSLKCWRSRPQQSTWLGHASLRTTAIYGDVVGPDERAFAERMWSGSS